MTPPGPKSWRCKPTTPSPTRLRSPPHPGSRAFQLSYGDLDATVGIIHVKPVFEIPSTDSASTLLTTVAKLVTVVPSTLDGDAVMAHIRAGGLQTALVVDEYGGTASIR